MSDYHVEPTPSDEEAVAIVVAMDAAWPRSGEPGDQADVAPRWRWSGRWWTKPVPMGRARPW